MMRLVASNSSEALAMTEQAPLDLRKMPVQDALHLAIGQYVTNFSTIETAIAAFTASVLKIDIEVILFLFKDMPISQKIKILRRAVIQAYGEEKSAAIRSILNAIVTASEFRNDLLHGTFLIEAGGASTLQGKLGQSLTDPLHGLESINYSQVQKATDDIAQAAGSLALEVMKFTHPSNSKSREGSGLGSQ
jgi:hypothetical protein